EAGELDGVEATPIPGGLEWRLAGVLFAVLDGEAAEFRLSAPVAAAALRTPGTTPSVRGASWVAFRPQPVDGHALDRAIAWLGSARRGVGSER
ncbi:MAG TPA: hypothetical protein VFO73_03040, partial [Candidatus Limnocylindrales bacterium]|nr:hypothetical protein [Candidatus Limnocylindrales bacterium]